MEPQKFWRSLTIIDGDAETEITEDGAGMFVVALGEIAAWATDLHAHLAAGEDADESIEVTSDETAAVLLAVCEFLILRGRSSEAMRRLRYQLQGRKR